MIRRLDPDEFELLRELRLGALSDSPDAFGSSYSTEVTYSENEWRHLLRREGNPTFVDEDESGTNGLVVAARDASDAREMWLVAMWVRPWARRSGVGDALVRRVLRWAVEQSATRVRLSVVESNEDAERLYARNGFVRTGRSEVRERDAAREVEMQLIVSPSS
ncbi:GNAT family N-acetyltransferase [Ilumatobacter nonamiensis]|uniref:GNAT family N-acetyltransferase n=1 Tax=Ilumatobacter nonamiensis TaxID=467093 RepID=UPI00034661C8|nr:GNAT family N-acetyltransferase [Ilumatobacter nonamiensis]